jgi:hypothetical protein
MGAKGYSYKTQKGKKENKDYLNVTYQLTLALSQKRPS